MADVPTEPTTLEARFEEAAAAYLRAREEGRAPDPERYLQNFPELASRLREFFADLALFDRLAPDLASTPTHPPAAAEAATLPPATPAPGRRVEMAGYEIIEELGRGGMGVVYRARHQKLGHEVALKMVLAGSHASEQELARFHLEAAAVARLKHPSIVHIHDFGEHDGVPYFSLELVEGGSLAARLKAGPLPARKAAALVEKLARAMAHAHEHGIVHRDLKPANVLLTREGEPKVADFGLAKNMDTEGASLSGAVLGTPAYMAPEQAEGRGRDIGRFTDVWALGVILYECLTGRVPFQGATVQETLGQIVRQEPTPPRRLVWGLPRDLETVCLRCLEKNPAKRYATAAELADDLGRFLGGKPVRARPVGPLGRGWRWARRNPAGSALAATLLGAAVILGYFAFRERDARDNWDKEREAAERMVYEYRNEIMTMQLMRVKAVYQSDPEEARRLLDACPKDLRDFSWGLYRRWCGGNGLTIRARFNPGYFPRPCFSPDGKSLAVYDVAGKAKTVRLLDVDTGEDRIASIAIPGQWELVSPMCFSPDGKTLAAATDQSGSSNTCMLRLWDATTGKELTATPVQWAQVGRMCFSPDGKTLAVYERSGVLLWDAATGKELTALQGGGGAGRPNVF
jgi:tRNA A-37 threonylcarbamoyl transferase component Bud32